LRRLSIITINFNDAKGLEKTLGSVLDIDLYAEEVEWIVIDGGSRDNSLDVIQKNSRKVSKWISESDKGIYDAMNKGIDYATGEYIIFMNAGDCFFDFKLIKAQLSNWYEDIVYGNFISSNSKGERELVSQTAQLDFLYFLSRTINHQSVFIRTELVKKYRFDTSYSIVADWIMLFNILKFDNPQISYVNLPVCIYDITGISSVNSQEREFQKAKFLKSIYSDWELNQLITLSRMRKRKWFNWFYHSFHRESVNFWMSVSSKIFSAIGK
jgi:glycosyltransferase involved in cell wall biosynthesis